jgi:5-methylcytosine-specific restriction endonuclease McrA
MLNERTLVLNRDWLAIDTCSVRRAICMLYIGAARVVVPESYQVYDWLGWLSLDVKAGEPSIRAVHFSIRVPEILLLVSYDRLPRKRVVFSRRNLYRRDQYTCQYCGARPGRSELSIDHVLPKSRGGRSGWTNCVVACKRCNKRKAHRTLSESGLRLLRDPREPVWGPYMTLSFEQRRLSWEPFVTSRGWECESDNPQSAAS